MLKTLLKLLAPYFAVAIFWLVFKNAWLSILAYHAQILLWSRAEFKALSQGLNRKDFFIFALPCAFTGLVAYVLLPFMYPESALTTWLMTYQLEGLALLLMLPYFGIIHPPLEQMHWVGLREKYGLLAHAAFAGYHAIVLASLLTPLWVVLALIVLFTVSLLWNWLYKKNQGLAIPALTHVLADTGIIVAAYLIAKKL